MTMKSRVWQVNIFFYLLLAYIFAILCSDYFTYFLSLSYLPSLFLGALVSFTFFFLMRKKIQIKNDFEKSDVIFFLFLLLILAITIVFPDNMFDSLNYHLLNQEQPFKDVTGKYFFPSSNINSTTFALGDRLFYPWRLLCGYRLGVILNYFYLIVIYYQVKKLLKYFLSKQNSIFVAIATTFIVLTLSVLDIIDTYYVDLLSVICLLELTIFCFLGPPLSERKKENLLELVIFSFLCGLSFCIKFSNAFFVIVFVLLYWYYHKDLFKRLNLKIILCMILSFLLPFFVYMLYTYLMTGNPVFPFYNQIFHSKYLANVSWMDSRLGPKGLLETLIWPIKMLLVPSRANDVYIIEPLWALGYLVAFYYFFRGIINKIRKKPFSNVFILSVIVLLCFFLWGKFSLGYIRYGIFILLLGGILVALFIKDIFEKKNLFFIFLTLLGGISSSYYFIDQYVFQASYISFHNIFSEGFASYKYNLQHLFDRSYDRIELPENSALGPIAFDSGFLYLMDSKDPIINLFIHKEGLGSSYYLSEMEAKYQSYEKVYSGVATFKWNEFLNNANYFGYQIKSFYNVYHPTFLTQGERYYLFEIEKVEKANNTYQSQIDYTFDVVDSHFHFEGIVGLNSHYLGHYDEIYLEFVDDKGQVKYHEKIDNETGKLYDINEDFEALDTSQLYLRLVDSQGNQLNDVELIIINLQTS